MQLIMVDRSAIIEYLEGFAHSSTNGIAVAYAYCDWQAGKTQSAAAIIGCFIRQLLDLFWNTKKLVDLPTITATHTILTGFHINIMGRVL